MPSHGAGEWLGYLEMKEVSQDDEGRLHEECGRFLLHFDEYGKGIPVMKNELGAAPAPRRRPVVAMGRGGGGASRLCWGSAKPPARAGGGSRSPCPKMALIARQA